jgi:tetrapyrrole methylase family protein / MazG family protein
MGRIIVIGLGPGNPGQVTEEARRYLSGSFPVFFRTLKHPAAEYYADRKKNCYTFDRLYETKGNFEAVYRSIVARLIKAAQRYRTVCYAVPGDPSVGEVTVERLRRAGARLGIEIKIVPGLSFLEPLLSRLKIDLLDGVTVIDALAIDKLKEPCRNHLILAQVYNRSIASGVKLKLLELYPEDFKVTVIKTAGMAREKSWNIPLHALDHRPLFDHLTTLYLPPYEYGRIGTLTEIMSRLRSDTGCPWDRKQDHRSLRQYLIEEAYEVVAAIDRGDDHLLQEELGDLLLQVVFHSQIAREENRFDFGSVVDSISTKLIRRHPHVFGQGKAADASEVKVLWEQIKKGERDKEKSVQTLGVDHDLPALLKAYKLQVRAAEAGFDWPCIQGPLDKAREELLELEEACRKNDRAEIEEEMGDFLFTAVNVARFLAVNPEMALGLTIGKFINRYQYVTAQAEKAGRPLSSFSLEELDKWWEEAKKISKISK